MVVKNKTCVRNECVERLNERHFSLLFVTLKLMPRRHELAPVVQTWDVLVTGESRPSGAISEKKNVLDPLGLSLV